MCSGFTLVTCRINDHFSSRSHHLASHLFLSSRYISRMLSNSWFKPAPHIPGCGSGISATQSSANELFDFKTGGNCNCVTAAAHQNSFTASSMARCAHHRLNIFRHFQACSCFLGAIVWTPLKGHPAWPAKVARDVFCFAHGVLRELSDRHYRSSRFRHFHCLRHRPFAFSLSLCSKLFKKKQVDTHCLRDSLLQQKQLGQPPHPSHVMLRFYGDNTLMWCELHVTLA